jgi:APA family basic amino acid/polyamine antiporter
VSSRPESSQLVRQISTWDATLITIGSILGTGIFITTGDIARALPHAGLILLVWIAGGLLTLAGALTYAELGTMFPRAGGQYQFLKETYGTLWGFLFGWASFLVVMSGGIAALAAGFGQYLGVFLPIFSSGSHFFSLTLGPLSWSVNGTQIAAASVIALLSTVNYLGVREGVLVQNVVTIIKIGSLVGLAVVGLFAGAPAAPALAAPLPAVGLLSGIGVGMIGVLWTYDGWYNVTFSAGEVRDPARTLPRALMGGTLAVIVLYTMLNVVYVRALPPEAMGMTGRVGEAAATALFGDAAGRLVSAAVLVSTFGCLSSTILCCSRIYVAMAQDGVFFRPLARIHPRYQTPAASILAQGLWASMLSLSGTYEQLYTYVVFAAVIFHAMTGSAVLVLRRTRPDANRPYRVWGYPWVPLLFIVSSVGVVVNTLMERPRESMVGLVLILLGVPAYYRWRQRTRELSLP